MGTHPSLYAREHVPATHPSLLRVARSNSMSDSCHLDRAERASVTVKNNVAWDENDYQIDAASEAGAAAWRRIIDRNAEFGVTHAVYEPRNT